MQFIPDTETWTGPWKDKRNAAAAFAVVSLPSDGVCTVVLSDYMCCYCHHQVFLEKAILYLSGTNQDKDPFKLQKQGPHRHTVWESNSWCFSPDEQKQLLHLYADQSTCKFLLDRLTLY